jgi:hypothetical protein
MLNIQSLKTIHPAFFAEKKVKVRCASASTVRARIPSDDTNTRFLSYLSFDGWVSRTDMVRLTGYSLSTISKVGTFLMKKGVIIKDNEQRGGSRPVFFQKVKG